MKRVVRCPQVHSGWLFPVAVHRQPRGTLRRGGFAGVSPQLSRVLRRLIHLRHHLKIAPSLPVLRADWRSCGAVRSIGRPGMELSHVMRVGRPGICQPQASHCHDGPDYLQWTLHWSPVLPACGDAVTFRRGAPYKVEIARLCRGARDHGLKVVGLPSRFASFDTDNSIMSSRTGASDASASAPAAGDWWSSGAPTF